MTPVGREDIARRFQVTVHAVDQWRRRNTHFPQPVTRIGQSPIWDLEPVLAWGHETGRL